MNAAAPEGTPPRRINAQNPVREHRTVPPFLHWGPEAGSPHKHFIKFYALEKPFRNSDALFGMQACPAAMASPSGDVDVVPVRELTQCQSKSESLYPNAPRHPTGDWWRKRGGFIQKKRFSPEQNFNNFQGSGMNALCSYPFLQNIKF